MMMRTKNWYENLLQFACRILNTVHKFSYNDGVCILYMHMYIVRYVWGRCHDTHFKGYNIKCKASCINSTEHATNDIRYKFVKWRIKVV